jgi:hypothetical protein
MKKTQSLNVIQYCKLPLNLGIDNCGSFGFTTGSVVALSSGLPASSSSFTLVCMNPVK